MYTSDNREERKRYNIFYPLYNLGLNNLESLLMAEDLENSAGANLEGADLQDSNFEGADLMGTNLKDANLSDATLTGANLEGITYNTDTTWPEGFTPPPSSDKWQNS